VVDYFDESVRFLIEDESFFFVLFVPLHFNSITNLYSSVRLDRINGALSD